jgi:hypothetical protein
MASREVWHPDEAAVFTTKGAKEHEGMGGGGATPLGILEDRPMISGGPGGSAIQRVRRQVCAGSGLPSVRFLPGDILVPGLVWINDQSIPKANGHFAWHCAPLIEIKVNQITSDTHRLCGQQPQIRNPRNRGEVQCDRGVAHKPPGRK